MWTAGPGRMRLPARAAAAKQPAPDSETPVASSPIWISWQGGMDFDGQLVRFLEQVEVSAIQASQSPTHGICVPA